MVSGRFVKSSFDPHKRLWSPDWEAQWLFSVNEDSLKTIAVSRWYTASSLRRELQAWGRHGSWGFTPWTVTQNRESKLGVGWGYRLSKPSPSVMGWHPSWSKTILAKPTQRAPQTGNQAVKQPPRQWETFLSKPLQLANTCDYEWSNLKWFDGLVVCLGLWQTLYLG